MHGPSAAPAAEPILWGRYNAMAGRPKSYVALLRGINVGGHHKIPMAGLRSICIDLECTFVQTYIQSGNVVLASSVSASLLEKRLETAIEREFGFLIPVIVRSASSWTTYVQANPFTSEASAEASRVLLCLSKKPPSPAAASQLQQRAAPPERVVQRGDAIWIYYATGIGRSRLTPAVLDRCVGSSVTARNWATVLKLTEMVRETDLSISGRRLSARREQASDGDA